MVHEVSWLGVPHMIVVARTRPLLMPPYPMKCLGLVMVGPTPSAVHIIWNWEALCGACFNCNLDGTMFVIIGYVSM